VGRDGTTWDEHRGRGGSERKIGWSPVLPMIARLKDKNLNGNCPQKGAQKILAKNPNMYESEEQSEN
jgi:hypothetical protein